MTRVGFSVDTVDFREFVMVNKEYITTINYNVSGKDGFAVSRVSTCSCCEHVSRELVARFEHKLDAEKFVAAMGELK